ncbi:MAG TPA: hypothetical protein PKK94_07515 [Leptospiraceae bacterium]|nr:hypothetical protein [Leptospiraceae bacterium]
MKIKTYAENSIETVKEMEIIKLNAWQHSMIFECTVRLNSN